MSAISTIPSKTETAGLVDATAKYAEVFAQLTHLQRATAKMMLGALDEKYGLTPERIALRKEILDALAWYTREVQRWVSSQEATISKESPNDSIALLVN